jgi:hypothetical protein
MPPCAGRLAQSTCGIPATRAGTPCTICAGETEQVPAISLPWFLDRVRRDLDLLKCDCEGVEYEIFHSLPDSYYRRIGKIIMEYHESILRREHAEFYSEFEAALRRNYSQVRTEPISPGMTMILAWRE